MKRDLLCISDLTRDEVEALFSLAQRLKADRQEGWPHPILAGKTLAMIFEKPSLRTRVTFEAGMDQLGGYAIYLSPQDIGLGTRETVPDVARNLSRWVDLVMARTFSHQALTELAQAATIPVINGLSDLLHPCQVLADCLTLLEQRGALEGLKLPLSAMAITWCIPGYTPRRNCRFVSCWPARPDMSRTGLSWSRRAKPVRGLRSLIP